MLDLESLPRLPQLAALLKAAPKLWEQPDVAALWIGGSIARGKADRYSDVDLRIAVRPEALEAWRQPDLPTLFAGTCVGQMFLSFGEQAFLHHLVLSDGAIYDVWVQNTDAGVHDEYVLILGCRDINFARHLAERPVEPTPVSQPARGDTVRQQLEIFWINSHKHRKVLDRGLPLLALTEIHTERMLLLRLWYIQATGHDCGEMRAQTIHGLTHLMRTVEQAKGTPALAILGAALANPQAIHRAIEQLRDEIRLAGQALTTTLKFDYPERLEQTVRQGWQEFLQNNG